MYFYHYRLAQLNLKEILRDELIFYGLEKEEEKKEDAKADEKKEDAKADEKKEAAKADEKKEAEEEKKEEKKDDAKPEEEKKEEKKADEKKDDAKPEEEKKEEEKKEDDKDKVDLSKIDVKKLLKDYPLNSDEHTYSRKSHPVFRICQTLLLQSETLICLTRGEKALEILKFIEVAYTELFGSN